MLGLRALLGLRSSFKHADRLCIAHNALRTLSSVSEVKPPAPGLSVVNFPLKFSVAAYYVGKEIDIDKVYQEHKQRKILRKDCVILYGPFNEDLPADIQVDEFPYPNKYKAKTPAPKGPGSPETEEPSADAQPQVPEPGPHRSPNEAAYLPPSHACRDVRHQWRIWRLDTSPNSPLEVERMMVVQRFGAVTFFDANQESRPIKEHWEIIRVVLSDYTRDPIPIHITAPEGSEWDNESEEYVVEVEPSIKEWIEQRQDAVCIQRLDLGTLELIALSMGQSIGLKYHNWMITAVLRELHRLRNRALATDGAINTLDALVARWGPRFTADDLAKVVLNAMQLRIEVTYSMKLLDRNRLAWNRDRYHAIWELLRQELEIEGRHNVFEEKLNFMAKEMEYDTGTAYSSGYDRLVKLVIGLLVMGLGVTAWEELTGHEEEG